MTDQPDLTALAIYLGKHRGSERSLHLTDVELIIGAKLPAAAHERRWWTNFKQGDARRRHSAAWHDAGFSVRFEPTESVVYFRPLQRS